MPSIEEIISGRDLIPWKDLGSCFKASPRHSGLTSRTIQAWQALGMPYVREGHTLLFSWPEVWAWYKVRFHRGQTK